MLVSARPKLDQQLSPNCKLLNTVLTEDLCGWIASGDFMSVEGGILGASAPQILRLLLGASRPPEPPLEGLPPPDTQPLDSSGLSPIPRREGSGRPLKTKLVP